MVKIKRTISVDKDVYEKFASYCRDKGMKVSSKINLMMKDVIKEKK